MSTNLLRSFRAFAFCLAPLFLLNVGCNDSDISLEDLEAAASKVDAGEVSLESADELAASADLEKTDLKFGFIKLTDCAPLVIAKEKGYFEDEGLNVEIEAQSNWKVLLDRVIDGQLDGAHMLGRTADWRHDWFWHQVADHYRIQLGLQRQRDHSK